MFNNFLLSFNQRPYENQYKTEFDRYMVDKVLGKNTKVHHPFHIDCSVTQKKICYCRSSKEQLMDQKSREYHHSLASYLKDYYSGITDDDYKKAFNSIQLYNEKIQNMEEITDLKSIIPKFQIRQKYTEFQEEKQKQEKKKQEQEKIEAVQGLEQGLCYLCQKTHSFTFYEVYEQRKQYTLCHECCTLTRPNVIARKHLEDLLLHKRGKLPVHLRQLKEKLKRKRDMKLRLLEASIEEQEEIELVSDSDDNFTCQSQQCLSEISDKKNPLIKCKSCERTWHPQCLETPLNYNLVKRFDYFCTECKLCNICWKTGGEEFLLMCDCCDRAFHMDCRDPPITNVPEGKWFCDDCVKCASCKCTLLTNENFNSMIQEKYAQQTIDNKIICDNCWVYYKKKEYCPGCYQVVKNDEQDNYVYCEGCNLWIHFKCEQLTEEQTKEVEKIKNYTCKSCKEAKHKEEAIQQLKEKLASETKIGKIDKQENQQGDESQQQQQQQTGLSKRSLKRGPQQDLKSAYYDDDSDSENIDDDDDDDDYKA